jgi:IS5 family transposase
LSFVLADGPERGGSEGRRLKNLGIKPRIMHKSWRGGPRLSVWKRRHNMLIAPIRAQIEGVFATLKRWLGLAKARYVGLRKNTGHIMLLAMAYNMNQSLRIA